MRTRPTCAAVAPWQPSRLYNNKAFTLEKQMCFYILKITYFFNCSLTYIFFNQMLKIVIGLECRVWSRPSPPPLQFSFQFTGSTSVLIQTIHQQLHIQLSFPFDHRRSERKGGENARIRGRGDGSYYILCQMIPLSFSYGCQSQQWGTLSCVHLPRILWLKQAWVLSPIKKKNFDEQQLTIFWDWYQETQVLCSKCRRQRPDSFLMTTIASVVSAGLVQHQQSGESGKHNSVQCLEHYSVVISSGASTVGPAGF